MKGIVSETPEDLGQRGLNFMSQVFIYIYIFFFFSFIEISFTYHKICHFSVQFSFFSIVHKVVQPGVPIAAQWVENST